RVRLPVRLQRITQRPQRRSALRRSSPEDAAELGHALLALPVRHPVQQEEVVQRLAQVPLTRPVEDSGMLLLPHPPQPRLPVGHDRLARHAGGDRPAPRPRTYAPPGEPPAHPRPPPLRFPPQDLQAEAGPSPTPGPAPPPHPASRLPTRARPCSAARPRICK